VTDSEMNSDRAPLSPLRLSWERLEAERSDNESALFYELMILGENLIKVIGSGLVAAVVDGTDRHQYRACYQLVRADGVGTWHKVLAELANGPAASSRLLDASADFDELCTRDQQHDWVHQAVSLMEEAVKISGENPDTPSLPSFLDWMQLFAQLRNQQRAHGAITRDQAAQIVPTLEKSLELASSKPALFERSWVHLRQNLSGKYRVRSLSQSDGEFRYLKSESQHRLEDGVYVWIGEPRRVALLWTDDDVEDFYVPNGGYRSARFETLSAITNLKRHESSNAYSIAPSAIPASVTKAKPDLEVVGSTFTNVPSQPSSYVSRPSLEAELSEVLGDDRHPVITLVGPGGIGKTSLALQVLHEVAGDKEFWLIYWLSARDIDLESGFPALVRPDVANLNDMASSFFSQVDPDAAARKEHTPEDFLRNMLSDREADPILMVLDNFETVYDPAAVYQWFSNVVRLPHKVVITTRLREFKADYPIEVSGMGEAEFSELAMQTMNSIGKPALLSNSEVGQLRDTIGGHPYMAKVLIGQAAVEGKLPSPRQYLAQADQLLEALFERTYDHLNTLERRAFLTLANWRSAVSRLALTSVLAAAGLPAVDAAIDRLVDFSMIERASSGISAHEWLSVPLAGSVFGRKKLTIEPLQLEIRRDSELLQEFGVVQGSPGEKSLTKALRRVTKAIVGRVGRSEGAGDLVETLLFIARSYPPAWLSVAELSAEVGTETGLPTQTEAFESYLQSRPDDHSVWQKLRRLHYRDENAHAEVAALIQMVQLPDSTMDDYSLAANRLNALHNKLSDREIERSLAETVITLMERVIDNEGTADDRSRLAWLYLRTKRTEDARRHVRVGLEQEPLNSHCLKLAERLEEDGDGLGT